MTDKVKESSCEVVLLRHAHSTANSKGILAGRNNRVGLTDRGQKEAIAVGQYLSTQKFDAIYSSPLKRCQDTLEPFLAHSRLKVRDLPGVVEMEYGTWSGKSLKALSKEPLWKTIQSRPSTVTFPRGESFMEMWTRANEAVLQAAKGKQRILVTSHGDVIKAVLAFHLGSSLDSFQRIMVEPASISVIRVPSSQVVLVNQTSHLKSTHEGSGKIDRFTLGGGAGRI